MSANERPFYYVSDDHHLYAETSAGSGVFDIIFAGDVLACDWNFDTNTLALLCPDDARTGQHFRTDGFKNMVRLFRVVDSEVTDLIDEVETAVATCVLWAGNHHVVCSNPEGVTTIFELKANRLKLSVQDGGAYPFCAQQGLGIVNREAQLITVWDLYKDKTISKETLPNRHAKKGKTRAACSTCSTGHFCFVVNDDATLHAAYCSGRTLKLLKPMISIFSPDTRRPKRNESLVPPVHSVVAFALSASHVLVAAPGLPDVYRMRYDKKEHTLAVVDKAKVGDQDVVLDLRKDRCLVKRSDGARIEYLVAPLDFHPLAERKRNQPPTTSESASSEIGSSSTTADHLEPNVGGAPAPQQRARSVEQDVRASFAHISYVVVGGVVVACAFLGILGALAVRAVTK